MGGCCPRCGARLDDGSQRFCQRCGQQLRPGDPLVGCVLDGRFHIGEVLESGGMGVVYRGTEVVDGVRLRPVAVKVLRPRHGACPEARARFLRERNTLTRLNHPNIIVCLTSGVLPDGRLYIVMPLVDGPTSRETLEASGALSLQDAVQITEQVALGLEHCHAHAVIHRDLKPANVLLKWLGARYHAWVLDFGIAQIDGEAGLTRDDTVIGTPGYMAPEQATRREVTDRTDIYALGACLYEWVVGEPMFPADLTPVAILLRQQRQGPVSMPGAPTALEGLVSDMVDGDPRRRPESMSAVVAHLQEIRRTLGIPTPPPTSPAPGA